MRPPATTIEAGAHLAAAAYLIKHLHDSALVVTTDDTHEPVVMITDAELTQAIADRRDLESTRVTQVVKQKPLTVDTDVAAVDAAGLMLSTGVLHLPVVDGRRLVGMVDLADLCRAILEFDPAATGTPSPGLDGTPPVPGQPSRGEQRVRRRVSARPRRNEHRIYRYPMHRVAAIVDDDADCDAAMRWATR